MILDQWWVYAGIAVWAVVLDSVTLLSASATFRFFCTTTGVPFLLLRAIAALVAGLILPVMLTQDLRLDEFPIIVVFLAPLITATALEFLLASVGASSTNEQTNLLGLIADLRRTTVVDALRKSNEAKQAEDMRTARGLAENSDSKDLRRTLLDLLHTKMPTLSDAQNRLGQLTAGMSANDEPALRQELATELVKIDRNLARLVLRELLKTSNPVRHPPKFNN